MYSYLSGIMTDCWTNRQFLVIEEFRYLKKINDYTRHDFRLQKNQGS